MKPFIVKNYSLERVTCIVLTKNRESRKLSNHKSITCLTTKPQTQNPLTFLPNVVNFTNLFGFNDSFFKVSICMHMFSESQMAVKVIVEF